METKGFNKPAGSNGRISLASETAADDAFLPSAPDTAVNEYHFDSDGFRQLCPRLYTLLAKQVVKGKPRETATVRLFADGGRLKAAIHDKASGQTFWATLEAASDPLMELEGLLAAGRGDWRKDRPQR